MESAVGGTQRQADVGRRAQRSIAAIARDNADNVATAQSRFDCSNATFGNFVKRPRGNLRFHFRERPKQAAIMHEVAIVPPAACHFPGRMRHAHATKRASQISDQTAPVIVVKPIFQVMEAREIFAGAFGVAITIHLDVMQ